MAPGTSEVLVTFAGIAGLLPLDGHVGLRGPLSCSCRYVDSDSGRSFITVAIAQGVGEHVGRTGTVNEYG